MKLCSHAWLISLPFKSKAMAIQMTISRSFLVIYNPPPIVKTRRKEVLLRFLSHIGHSRSSRVVHGIALLFTLQIYCGGAVLGSPDIWSEVAPTEKKEMTP